MTTPVTLLDWDAAGLQTVLRARLPGLQVEVAAELGSTNTDLQERRRAGALPPTLLVAERQTAGRGRLGRHWWSQPGQTLTFSLGLVLEPRDWSGLSLRVGLAIAQALGEPSIGLKWPNDLWLRGEDRKLAGVLIEVQPVRGADGLVPPQARWVVIGVGLNVLPRAGTDADEAATFGSGYACVQEFDPDTSAPAVLHRVAPLLLDAVLRFQTEGMAPHLGAYAQRDVLAARAVRAGELHGVAAGLAPDGALLLRLDDGTLRPISSGEVSVRPC